MINLNKYPLSKIALAVCFTISTAPYAHSSDDVKTPDALGTTDAETNSEITDAETIVVTGAATNDTSLTALDQEQIQLMQTQDTADLFRNQTSVSVGGGSRQAQRIYVRGIESSNLNVTIDGAKQGRNLFQHRGNISGIDAGLLKSVEVSTLPSSDQGAGSLGGSIKYQTVDAQDLLSADKHIGAKIKTGYGSVDNSENGSVSLYAAGEKVGILAHVATENFENYKTGDGTEIKGSAGQDREYFLKISALDLNNHDISLSLEQNKNSGLYRYGGGDTAYDADATLVYQISERNTITMNHAYSSPKNSLVNIKDTLYYNKSTLENQTSDTLVKSESIGGDIKNLSRFHIKNTQHDLSYGIDYYVESGKTYTDGSQTGIDSQSNNLGLFIQERMNWGKAKFALGTRFDSYNTDYGTTTFDGTEWSPSMSFNYELLSGFNAFAGYGESVRSTGVIPIQWLSSITGTPTFNTQTGKNSYNKAFKPETSQRTEYGIDYKVPYHSDYVELFRIKLTAFDTEIKNLIQQIGGSQGAAVTGFYNDDPITSKGYEANIQLARGQLASSISFTHAKTVDQDGNRITVTRRIGASTGDQYVWNTQWSSTNDTIKLGYTFKYVDSLHADEIDRDSYAVHDMNAAWNPVQFDGLTLSLSIFNLFNENYADQTSIGEDGTAVYEPGRDFRLSVAYKF
ncbi:TonB-dependent receptor domain-containing protein [Vibrio sp. HA2012]|uniref:TonB-dependent receptor domain-containing protein n=1 Tax=Vibrio sp. HA2012 TaxID=1971595 RepID=UPI0018E23A47|nr:TonB-dependent receptor [Vibrio sp. HA2012]